MLTNKIRFTYRPLFTNRGVKYDVSYYNDEQYADYKAAGLTNMIDGDRFIPSSRITKEIVPGVKSLRKAGVLEYSLAEIGTELQASLLNVAKSFGIEVKTKEEMLSWVKDNTDLVEETDTPGKFLIAKADPVMMTEEDIYLMID